MTAAVIYTPCEAAIIVGATESFVRELARRRDVPHLRVGRGAVRFTAAHLEALIAHLEQPATEQSGSLTTPRSRARRSA